ncbi:hypothetical protein NBRC116493_24580 [Aurantivibrio infirmus]
MIKNRASPDLKRYDNNRGVIKSTKGGWVIGQGVVCHGMDMMEDFVGKLSYVQVQVLNSTGKLPGKPLANWIEAVYICLSWPDPRIWCNNIGALGGTARASIIAATTAGVLATDARSYGVKPLLEGVEFIQRALLDYKNNLSVEELVKVECKKHGGKPSMMGYARPIAKGDERVPALERVRIQQGLSIGEHLSLAQQIDSHLNIEFDESINVNGYVSAFLSDQGFTIEEIYRIFTMLVASGVTACYVDTESKPAETFLPLRCDDIDYQGPEAREVPDSVCE